MKKAVFCLILVFLINLPSLYFGWYVRWWWVDIVLHFGGGFFVAMFMYHYLADRLIPGNSLKNIIIIAGATILVGVLWEFAEYIANQTLMELTYKYFGIRAYFMGDLNDTIADLLLDTLGSLAFIALSLKRKYLG